MNTYTFDELKALNKQLLDLKESTGIGVIRTDEENDKALEITDALVDLRAMETDNELHPLFALMGDLIHAYEETRYPLGRKNHTPDSALIARAAPNEDWKFFFFDEQTGKKWVEDSDAATPFPTDRAKRLVDNEPQEGWMYQIFPIITELRLGKPLL